MIYLVTGTPGASKTLNAIKEVCENNAFSRRPIYYNNIKCLVLDLNFLNSFEGFFYSKYLRSCSDEEKNAIKDIVKEAHRNNRLVSMNDVPFLGSEFREYNYIDEFLHWCKRLYKKERVSELERFIDVCRRHNYKIRAKHIRRFNLDWRRLENPHEWFKLEAGSVIVIDEVQNFFGKRSASSKAPDYIEEFNTHRHKGFDLILITQDSSLIDYQLKACVNKHIHYKNLNGGDKVSRLEHNSHFNVHSSTERRACDFKQVIKRDSKFYGSYYSAELHTHKYKMPQMIKKLFYVVPVLLIAIYFSINTFLDLYNFDLAKNIETKNDSVILEETNTMIEDNKNEKGNCIITSSNNRYCI